VNRVCILKFQANDGNGKVEVDISRPNICERSQAIHEFLKRRFYPL
jgi:hypothetical protein